jgi:hypothetical protein
MTKCKQDDLTLQELKLDLEDALANNGNVTGKSTANSDDN